MASIATVQRITAANLAKVILAGGDEAKKMAIVDVRDEGESTRPTASPLNQILASAHQAAEMTS